MRTFAISAVSLAFLLVSISGCSDSTEPVVTPGLVMTLETTIDQSGSDEVVRAQAVVKNVGDVAARYPINCSYFVSLSMKDETGRDLVLRDPALVPVCPPGFFTLDPAASVGGGVVLTSAWDENGSPYDVPAGSYSVRASFTYYLGTNDEPLHLEEELRIYLE